MALERIVLNIIPEGEMPVFHCSQYEKGRPVIIDLVSSDDDAFLVPEGATVELHCRKVDDNIVTLESDEVDSNTVTFVSTEQLTACPGDNLCELVLYADTDPVQTIATLNFILHVEPDPLEGGLTSETQIYNLTQQVEEITQQVIGDDYYNKTEVDDLLDDKADKATTYTKSEVDTALNLKADKATTYTKTQVDSALALKANAADVYTKAQTYSQAEVDALIDNIFPTLTASGPIASFTTALTKQLISVSADPLASIITCCGINLWDEEWELGYYNTSNGQPLPISDRIRTKNFIPITAETAFRLVIPSSYYIMPLFYDKDKNYLGYIANGIYSGYQNPFTSLANACYMTFYVSPSYGTAYNNDISINYPSTDTSYHAYSGQTVPVADATTLVTQSGVNNVYADVGNVTVQYKYMSM